MVWCNNCQEDVEAETYDGASSCATCGVVLDDAAFSTEVTFTKGAGGESAVDGQRVTESGIARGMGSIGGSRNYGSQIDSKEKSLMRGRAEIQSLVSQLRIQPATSIAEGAHRLYGLALAKNFTRGRRTAQVAAACVYMMCREERQPFMLIDFSDALQVNVFVLGAVYVQLIQLLRLQDEPAFSRPTDPSLYLDRYAAKLGLEPRARMQAVVSTSLQLVKSMKRDWMQTGRRPAGICGAALFIALHIHGFQKTKAEVTRVVNVGVTTLANRIREFGATETGELTNAQLKVWDRGVTTELEEMMEAPQHMRLSLVDGCEPSEPGPLVAKDITDEGAGKRGLSSGCPHIGQGIPPTPAFAHGLCRSCFMEFLQTTGGRHAGALPPAFQKNLQKEERLRKEAEERAEAELMLLGGEQPQEQLLLTAGGDDGTRGSDSGVSSDMDSQEDMQAAHQQGSSYTAQSSGTRRITRSSTRQRQAGTSAPDEPAAEQQASKIEGDPTTKSPHSKHCRPDSVDASDDMAELPRQRRRLQHDPAVPSSACAADGEHAGELQLRDGTGHPLHQSTANDMGVLGHETSNRAQNSLATDVTAGIGKAAAEASERAESEKNDEQPPPVTLPQQPDDGAGSGGGGFRAGEQLPSGRIVHFASYAEVHEPVTEREDVASSGDAGDAQEGGPGMELALVPTHTDAADHSNGEEAGPDTFSDIDDSEIDMFLLTNEERDLKEKVWTTLNEDWLEKQAAKEEAQAAGQKVLAERQAAAEAQLAAAGEEGSAAPKRGRGRPLGSKTRNHSLDLQGGPSDTAGQAAMRMLENRKLSSKINYNVLANLFSDADPASGGGGKDGGSPGSQKDKQVSGKGADVGSPASPASSNRRLGGREPSNSRRGRQPGLLDDIGFGLSTFGAGNRTAGRGGFAPRVKR